jgi:type IV fimbrial biogenesis protein FimT
MKHPRQTQHFAFSMRDLVTGLTISAAICAVAVPGFKYLESTDRSSTEISALAADLRYARNVAVDSGLPVTVCASSDGTTCEQQSSQWHTGWIVFTDLNDDRRLATGVTPLRVRSSLAQEFGGNDTLAADNSFKALTYKRNGFGNTHIEHSTDVVTLVLTTPHGGPLLTRCLAITPIGAPAIQKAGQGHCA